MWVNQKGLLHYFQNGLFRFRPFFFCLNCFFSLNLLNFLNKKVVLPQKIETFPFENVRMGPCNNFKALFFPKKGRVERSAKIFHFVNSFNHWHSSVKNVSSKNAQQALPVSHTHHWVITACQLPRFGCNPHWLGSSSLEGPSFSLWNTSALVAS